MTLNLKKLDADLGSQDEDVRWQAAIALGELCESEPELIWPLVLKWGSSENEDVRDAVATCMLEHILEFHFVKYFGKAGRNNS